MTPIEGRKRRLRVCAVSYLNTVPLVWGMLHGDQRGLFELDFCLPSTCASRLAEGSADIGIAPAIELSRQDLQLIAGAGIASRGPVRSILLVSKVPYEKVRTLAADSSSRTSVMLARIVLARRYGAEPSVVSQPPDVVSMLETADAALVIGDPALRIDPQVTPFAVTDLGEEWTAMTGLPMVFAVWAGRRECVTPDLEAPFLQSCRYGISQIEEIVRREAAPRGLPETLAREYLTRHIRFELGKEEYQGLDLFLQYAGEFATVEPSGKVSA